MLRPSVAFLILVLLFCDADELRGCASPQYVKVGETGVLQCTFSDYFGIFWYNTTDYVNSYSIINLKGSSKSGNGFLSGEYDIHLNGSLIIANVSWQHERQFTVLKFDSPSDKPVPHYVQVIVVATPIPAYPSIENCTGSNEVCIIEGGAQFDLKCSVFKSRPAVAVRWVERTPDGDKTKLYHTSVKHENRLTTSVSTLTANLNYTNILALYVCQVESVPTMLEYTESAVLVQNDMVNSLTEQFVRKYIKFHSQARLLCPNNDTVLFIWKYSTFLNEHFQVVTYGMLFGEELKYNSFKDYYVEENGILIITKLNRNTEGYYRCLYSDGVSDEIITYEVFGTVDPIPDYLVVNGCYGEEDCELKAETEGTLTCSLLGIRPLVQLEWRTVNDSWPPLVTFWEQRTTVAHRGDAFDIYFTTKYNINAAMTRKCVIECAVSGKHKDVFDLKRIVRLTFSTSSSEDSYMESTEKGTQSKSLKGKHKWIWIIPSVAVPLGLTVYMIFVCKGRRKDNWIDEDSTSLEMQHINPHECEHADSGADENEALYYAREISDKSLEERRDMFISQLKTSYAILYNAIRPIPYVEDHTYCVEKVFVESKIKFRHGYRGSEKWTSLETYKELLSDEIFSHTRRVLEADPGYGKSVTTLQIAYDWCNPKSETDPLNGKILILLRLRQLGGASSIYTAIKRLILPSDSMLRPIDVKDILQQDKSSVIFLFDGYDEYPNQESSNKTDILQTLMGKMFQQSTVILTTRRLCVPKQLDPQSVRMTMTGFDDEARGKYIRKAISGEDEIAHDRILNHLQENPIVCDICQIPLFFVMVAHITHEQKDTLNFSSVTNLFKYIIACCHSHMNLKLHGENLKKYEVEQKHHDRNLAKLAFDGLSVKKQKLVWKMDELNQKFGEKFVNFYQRVGFFVREDISAINFGHEIRFYHKLFCEWFAAHYMVQDLLRSTSVKDLCGNMNPSDLQFMFRFVCGLQPEVASRVIRYLEDKYTDIAILCFLELSPNVKDYKMILTRLSSSYITIRKDDNRLLQRAKIHLLQKASTLKISIGHVLLHECLQGVDGQAHNIVLKSGLNLPKLEYISNIEIFEAGRTFTVEELMGLLKFGVGCEHLQRIKFSYCVLPIYIDLGPMKSTKSFTVTWNSYELWQCKLDFDKGSWKLVRNRIGLKTVFKGKRPLTRELYDEMVKLTEKKQDEPYEELLRQREETVQEADPNV